MPKENYDVDDIPQSSNKINKKNKNKKKKNKDDDWDDEEAGLYVFL